MFNSISGIVTAKNTESIYLLSGDIEWDITMPSNDIQSLSLKSESRILTWLYHKEDQMKLFGFLNENRRNTFLELLKVDGIGPKGAVKIMAGLSQEELERALETGDLARLEAVPGLGKKTAQKMLLSLKGKLVQSENQRIIQSSFSDSPYKDLIEALYNMGYDRKAAGEALAKAEETGITNEEALLNEAILYLTGN